MTKYACGHECNMIIMESSPDTFAAWIRWRDTVGYNGDKSMCWGCWCKQRR